MRLILRADASPHMGAGHVMRSMALALAAKAQGLDVCMACRIDIRWLRERLSKENLEVEFLDGQPHGKEDPATLLQHLALSAQGVEASRCRVVLDGYHFDPACQQAVCNAGYKLLVIDDYNHLPEYHCDILLNQNLGAEDYAYKGNIGKKLLGLRYLLLRPEFAAARAKADARELPETPQKILLTLGGGDFSKHLHELASCFCVPEMQGCRLRVIAGAMPEETIRASLRNCPADLELLQNVEDMPALLLDTDLCITAGGSTCWELCCLRVPFLTVEVADNQKGIVARLAESTLAPRFSREAFSRMLRSSNQERRNAMAAQVGSDGAHAVLEVLGT